MPQQMPQMTAQPPALQANNEQPRPVEPMNVESMRMRGGEGKGGAICCGICAGLACFECCECSEDCCELCC